jgi:hypothetical protein
MRGFIVGLFVVESLCLVFFGGCVFMLAGSSPGMGGPLTPEAERTGAHRHPVAEPPGHRTILTGPVASPRGRGRPQAG